MAIVLVVRISLIFWQVSFKLKTIILVCRDKDSGICNIYGTEKCSSDGNACVKCKFGYKGDRCQFCLSKDGVIEGFKDGIIDRYSGQGVKCSKRFLAYTLNSIDNIEMFSLILELNNA